MDAQFKGVNVIITGATGVIGSTFVKGLVAKGANVGILGRSEEKITALQNELGEAKAQTVDLVADVLDKVELERAKQRFNETFGTIDILINGAVAIIRTQLPVMNFMMLKELTHSLI